MIQQMIVVLAFALICFRWSCGYCDYGSGWAFAQDPMTLNGGSVLAMSGKDCVAVAVDKRFGIGNKLVNVCRRPVLVVPSAKLQQPPILRSDADTQLVKKEVTINSNSEFYDNSKETSVMVAFTGLEGDIHSLMIELSAQIDSKLNRGLGFAGVSNQGVSPTTIASLTSHILYQRKRSPYYVEPIVVGIEKVCSGYDDTARKQVQASRKLTFYPTFLSPRKKITPINDEKKVMYHYRPYLCSMDIIGAKSQSKSFVCSGAASKSLLGTAESYWRPNLSDNELLQVCGTAFLSALERDCLSGYGATIYLISSNGTITEYDVESRND